MTAFVYNIWMGTISPALGVAIMMNNYFHDVATGLLTSSGIALLIIAKKLENTKNRETLEYFLRIYSGMTKLARFSLGWILLGGIPRTIFYRDFEWANAVDRLQVPAIIVKHVLVFAIVGTGVYMWRKINRRVREIKQSLDSASSNA